jgi:hypothetical protein
VAAASSTSASFRNPSPSNLRSPSPAALPARSSSASSTSSSLELSRCRGVVLLFKKALAVPHRFWRRPAAAACTSWNIATSRGDMSVSDILKRGCRMTSGSVTAVLRLSDPARAGKAPGIHRLRPRPRPRPHLTALGKGFLVGRRCARLLAAVRSPATGAEASLGATSAQRPSNRGRYSVICRDPCRLGPAPLP